MNARRQHAGSGDHRRETVLFKGANTVVTTAFFESAGQRYPVTDLVTVRKAEQTSPRQYILCAWLRGAWVRLFASCDEQEFGQVCRALTRAREYAGLA